VNFPEIQKSVGFHDVSYRPQLDGLRAVCVLFTILAHIPGTRQMGINGSVGVDIFFALSGWLITTLLLEEQQTRRTLNIGAFYIRRFFRIVPLYYLTLALYGLAALTQDHLTGTSKEMAEYRYSLPELLLFSRETFGNEVADIFGHAWTLGIEEKYYLLFPLLGLLLFRRPLLLTALILTFCGAVLLLDRNYWMARGYCGLAGGSLLALAVHLNPLLREKLTRLPLALPCLGLLVLIYAASLTGIGGPVNIAIGLTGAPLVASLWHNGSQPLARMLRWSPLAFAGRYTYSIYLMHTLVLNVVSMLWQRLTGQHPSPLLHFALTWPACLLLGWAVWHTIEQPLIRTGRRVSARLFPA
jgi:peptidoglycan/LPS O-acetylase OafA/YrhL